MNGFPHRKTPFFFFGHARLGNKTRVSATCVGEAHSERLAIDRPITIGFSLNQYCRRGTEIVVSAVGQ